MLRAVGAQAAKDVKGLKDRRNDAGRERWRVNSNKREDTFLAKYRRVCPVCGKHVLDSYEICDCGWQNDPIQTKDPTFGGGANKMSLNEARAAYKEGRPIE